MKGSIGVPTQLVRLNKQQRIKRAKMFKRLQAEKKKFMSSFNGLYSKK